MAAANERFRVKLHPTALATDVLFYHVVDGRIGKNDTPAHGTPYHEALPSAPAGFDNHKLVHIAPVPRSPGEELWYFAADREDQDLYNFEWADADIGPTRFPTLKRSYLLPRKELTPATPAQGAAMPNIPEGLFTGSYVLAERQQGSSGDPILDSLYVSEIRVYVIKSTLDDITTDTTLGVGVKRSTTHYFRGEILTGSTPIETAATDPANAYWGVQTTGITRECKQLTANWWVVIATSSLDTARLAYKLAVPATTDLQLPAVLKSISCVWNQDAKNGSFASYNVAEWHNVGDPSVSIGAGESASADSSASVQGDIVPIIVHPEGRDIPCVNYFFYIKSLTGVVTQAEVIARLASLFTVTATMWPTFKPESHDITVNGQQLSLSANVSASASLSAAVNGARERNQKERTVGVGEGFSFGTSIRTIHIGETIHGELPITNGAAVSQGVTATCAVGWNSWAAGVTHIAGETLLIPKVDKASQLNYDQPDLDLAAGGKKITTGSISGSLSTLTLPATVPAAIPSEGFFITDMQVKPDDVHWFFCHLEVINATSLA